MSKLKHGLWVVALVAALAAVPVWAEETSVGEGWFADLVAQIVALVINEEATSNAPGPGDEPELSELVPVGG